MSRKDHLSSFWLFAFPKTAAEKAAREIFNWSTVFGVPLGLMFNVLSHSENETLFLLRAACRSLINSPYHIACGAIVASSILGKASFVCFVPSYRNLVPNIANGLPFNPSCNALLIICRRRNVLQSCL